MWHQEATVDDDGEDYCRQCYEKLSDDKKKKLNAITADEARAIYGLDDDDDEEEIDDSDDEEEVDDDDEEAEEERMRQQQERVARAAAAAEEQAEAAMRVQAEAEQAERELRARRASQSARMAKLLGSRSAKAALGCDETTVLEDIDDAIQGIVIARVKRAVEDFEIGLLAMEEKPPNARKAERLFRSAIDDMPDKAQYLLALAEALIELKQPDEALDCCARAEGAKSDSLNPHKLKALRRQAEKMIGGAASAAVGAAAVGAASTPKEPKEPKKKKRFVRLSEGSKVRVDEWSVDDAEQWGVLLESIPDGANKKDWRLLLGAFRGDKPMYVLSTRFSGQSFEAARALKAAAESGEHGKAGPCFNPNEDNVNYEDNAQAARDDRWLLVWQHMARQAKASGGKVLQLVDPVEGLSRMQRAEEDFADDLGDLEVKKVEIT